MSRPLFRFQAGSYTLNLGERTQIMGILNVTPDSFSRDGCLEKSPKKSLARAYRRALRMIREGADILDVGGESTRPGASRIPAGEEIRRVIPVISKLAKKTKIPISVDTCKAEVARRALDAGAVIVNDIRGVRPNKALLRMVKNYNAAVVLMHIRGTPRTMQKRIFYKDLIPEILEALRKSLEICLEIGIKSDRIMIDPGIGFGKTVEHNCEILNRLDEFRCLNQPILVGTSRKSFIGKILDKDVEHRLYGTLASVCIGISHGAHAVRVHDAGEARDAARVVDAIVNLKRK